MANEKVIWDFLLGSGYNEYGVAGIMGNLYAESALNPQNLQNSSEKKLSMTDQDYTNAVDFGKYTNFVHDSAGYGLAQWTYWSRKQNLLNYAKSKNKSIGDLITQLEFLVQELNTYKGIETVKNASSISQASDFILINFERPKSVTTSAKAQACAQRTQYGMNYYNQFTKRGGVTMTEQQLRQKVVDIITNWLGATKGSAKHKEILDIYNNYKPLARSYKVKVTDAYCATTVSAAYIKAGIAAYTGTECGANEYIKVAKSKGIWVEDDAHMPKIGDAIEYDWQDSGKGDNQGYADHIGIITSVGNGEFTVTEGNMSGGKVGQRTLKVNAKNIRGFICPDFAAIAKTMSPEEGDDDDMTQEQFNKMMDNYIAQLAVQPANAAWEQEALNWATNHGIMQGGNNGVLMPKRYLTRVEAAVMLKRLADQLGLK